MNRNTDQSAGSVSISRATGRGLVVYPSAFILEPSSFGINPGSDNGGQYHIVSPAGWRVKAVDHLVWRAVPIEIDLDQPVTFSLEIRTITSTQYYHRSVPVSLDLRSTFDPYRHPFPRRNNAAEIGEVLPQRKFLSETYSFPTGRLRETLFNGLYSAIVYLSLTGQYRGGLCSGMARWSISRAAASGSDALPYSTALEEIIVFHGRQLTDRALLAGLPWLVRGSPNAAYRAIRRDYIERGITDRAIDIGIPKLWRRDVFQALILQGHTVVPYRLRQDSPAVASLEVYDPNKPTDRDTPPQSITFQLNRNRYQYRNMVGFNDRGVGMVAVRQQHYQHKGTAILATVASAGLILGRQFRSAWKHARRRIPDQVRDSSFIPTIMRSPVAGSPGE